MHLLATFHSKEELISREAALNILRQTSEDDIFTLKTSDDASLIEFQAYENKKFFVEQYVSSSIYGGLYFMPVAETIIEKIFSGISTDELRHFFPTLDGHLVHEDPEEKAG